MPHPDRYYSDMVSGSLSAYLKNDRILAINLLDIGEYRKANSDRLREGKDGSSLLRCCHALFSLVEGLLSGSSDTMTQTIVEFWEAEKLANDSVDKEWIGNRLSRALSYMFGGLLQVFTHSYVKAGVNLTIGFKLARDLEKDVLDYTGPEPRVIRSLGLLLLGLMNMFSIILPASISTVGDYLGFGVSKEKYYKYTSQCDEENGDFAMMSNLIFIYFLVNSKNFLFDQITPDELRKCRKLIDSCLLVAPHSVIVHVMHASVCLGEGRPDLAVATLNLAEISQVLERPEWATMSLATYFKLGNSHLCNLDFKSARSAYQQAAIAVEQAGRWAYIPFMRTMEGLCFLAATSGEGPSSSTNVATAVEIFAPTFVSRDLSKNPIVLPGDRWGARVGFEQTVRLTTSSEDELAKYVASAEGIVDALFAMATCLYSFEKIEKGKLKLLIAELKIRQKHKRSLKFDTLLGEYHRLVGETDKAVEAFDDAVEVIDGKIRKGESEDPDSILGFSLVFQGAALCAANDPGTAKDVLVDLDEVLANAKHSKGGGILKTVWASPVLANALTPGNIVNLKGGELELILSFRRNGLKRRIDESK